MKKAIIFFFAVILSACSTGGGQVQATPLSTETSSPGVVALLSTPQTPPTPIAPGKDVTYKGLSVRMVKAEISDQYKTEFGTIREPSDGSKFLWIQVILENVATKNAALPDLEHYSVLYERTEFKPTYGHRDGYPDYASLETTVFPGKPKEAWLRFDIPAEAEMPDLQFAFLPESSKVTFFSSQSKASYYDHPVYLWSLE
jgi:hypothetical protein